MLSSNSNSNEKLMSKQNYFHFVNLATIFGLFVSSIVPSAHAQNGYPQPINLYANDYANVLSPEDEANIGILFVDLKRDTGIEAVVMTINSIRDYNTTDETFESFATGLFNTWGIGDKHKNNGILILVAVQDRRIRIEVSSGYGNSQNAAMLEIIDQQMVPSFKQGNYRQGISKGAQAIVTHFGGKRVVPSTPPSGSNQVLWGSLKIKTILENANIYNGKLVNITGRVSNLSKSSVVSERRSLSNYTVSDISGSINVIGEGYMLSNDDSIGLIGKFLIERKIGPYVVPKSVKKIRGILQERLYIRSVHQPLPVASHSPRRCKLCGLF